jgi:hypothetical protein
LPVAYRAGAGVGLLAGGLIHLIEQKSMKVKLKGAEPCRSTR